MTSSRNCLPVYFDRIPKSMGITLSAFPFRDALDSGRPIA
jgi:hypothetical protein